MKGAICLGITIAIPIIAYVTAIILGLTAQDHYVLIITQGKGEDLSPNFRGIPVASKGTCSYVRSKASNLWLHRSMWEPEGEARAVLIFAHGLTEHAGRYWNIPEAMIPQGIAVAMQDSEGHGHSEGDRGFISSFSRLVEDYIQFVKDVRASHPGIPVICAGHSMGSLINGFTAEFNNTNNDGSLLCDGVILTGLATQGRTERRVRVKPFIMDVFGAFSKVLPHLRLAHLATADQISTDPESVKEWVQDPYTIKLPLYTRMGEQLLRAQLIVADNADKIKVPLLLLHGANDTIAYPDSSRELYAKASTPAEDKKLIIYDDCRHCVLMEPKHISNAFDEISKFISARINNAKTA